MLQAVLVQQQRLEMHQTGDRARQRLDQVITEYKSVEIIEQPDGVRDLRDEVPAEREELQAGKCGNFYTILFLRFGILVQVLFVVPHLCVTLCVFVFDVLQAIYLL